VAGYRAVFQQLLHGMFGIQKEVPQGILFQILLQWLIKTKQCFILMIVYPRAQKVVNFPFEMTISRFRDFFCTSVLFHRLCKGINRVGDVKYNSCLELNAEINKIKYYFEPKVANFLKLCL